MVVNAKNGDWTLTDRRMVKCVEEEDRGRAEGDTLYSDGGKSEMVGEKRWDDTEEERRWKSGNYKKRTKKK